MIKASVPIAPEVVLNAYREIRVPVEPVVVTEDQVNALLDLLRRDTAPWEPVDRPVAMDDQVIMDIKATLDGKGDNQPGRRCIHGYGGQRQPRSRVP